MKMQRFKINTNETEIKKVIEHMILLTDRMKDKKQLKQLIEQSYDMIKEKIETDGLLTLTEIYGSLVLLTKENL